MTLSLSIKSQSMKIPSNSLTHLNKILSCSQPNLLTYATLGAIGAYLAYNIPVIYYFTKDPKPVPSDALKYDRATKKYIQ